MQPWRQVLRSLSDVAKIVAPGALQILSLRTSCPRSMEHFSCVLASGPWSCAGPHSPVQNNENIGPRHPHGILVAEWKKDIKNTNHIWLKNVKHSKKQILLSNASRSQLLGLDQSLSIDSLPFDLLMPAVCDVTTSTVFFATK